jgi:glycosyltransferase involved in cell wall biosynthesis
MQENHSSTSFRELPVFTGVRQSPLKICIASCEFIGPIRNGGIGTAYTAMAEALAKAGHQVTLFYTQGKKCENETIGHWEHIYRKQGLRLVARPSDPALRIDAPAHAVSSYETYRWLKNQEFDLVHFPEWGADAYYSLLAKHQGIAFARTFFCVGTHSPTAWIKEANSELYSQPRDLEVDFMERRCVALADFVVSPCQYMLHWMRDHGFELPAHSYVRQNILPASARSAPMQPADRQISEIVFFGRLETRKGIELFCDALDRLAGSPDLKNVKVTFMGKTATVGGRDSQAYIRGRAGNWPWPLSIISDLDQPGAMLYLRQPGRLAVIPSLMENSPYTVLECLGSRIPFLASRVGGIPELIAPEDLELATFLPHAANLAQLLQQTLLSGKRAWQPAVEATANEAAWVAWHAGLLESSLEKPFLPHVPQLEKPRVSVCVAHFNRPQMLKQALASLTAQDYSNFEVIIVDDGSTSAEAIRYLAELEPWLQERHWQLIRQENRYLSAARNTGARHASGDYLMFMDDDNFARPEEISTFIQVAVRTGADIVTACMDYFEGTQPPVANSQKATRWVPLGPAAAAGYFRNVFGDANCLVKKKTFEELGGFTEIHGVTHEDWEFLAHAVLKGVHLEVIPESLFHYRYTPGSMIRSTSQYRNHLRHIRPYLNLVPPALHQILLMAQGACKEQSQNPNTQPAFLQHSIKWRSELEAGRTLAKVGQEKSAIELLLTALRSAQASNHPIIILDAMLSVGRELRKLDAGRAREVLQLAIQLAEGFRNGEAIRVAKTALAEMAPAKTATSTPDKLASPAPIIKKIATDPAISAVSIVIPTFNNFALTQACLKSVADSAAAITFEIIVVDNASTDATLDLLRDLEKKGELRLIANPDNRGFAHACNQGAQIARSPLLLFLNNDTQVTAGWIDAMAQAAQQPGTGIVGARLLYADGHIQHAGIEFINGVPDHPHRHAAANTPEVCQFRELDMVTGACFMIHRELFLQLAGFDETYQNGVEDIDLCLRVRSAGRKVVYEPKAVVYHLEGRSVGRFNHVNENLRIFFNRWGKTFDAQKHFVVPHPVKIVPASRSLLLKTASADTAKPVNEPVKVDWIGSFLDHGSLSHVNRELTDAVNVFSDFQVSRISKGSLPSPAFEVQARNLRTTPSPDAAVTVRHAWPPDWKRPLNGKLAVIQPWEFGMLPETWVRQACDVDEFWVPSNFVHDCYLASGIPAQKVFVVPNGVDAEKFHPQAAPAKLSTQKKFKFLFVGGTIGRKGPDLLLKAYLQNFTAADDVCLVIKDFGGKSFYAGQTFESQIRVAQSLPDAPEILYLNEELPPESLPGLYTACDCFVLPYRGEGFGLPVLEAMACGRPVIVTAGGAVDDFVRDEFAWRIPATRKSIGNEVGGMKLAGNGWLLEPDPFVLGKDMRYAFANPDEARERGILASHHAHQFFSWKNSASIAARRIRELVASQNEPGNSTPVKAAPTKLPPVALVGQLHEARRLLGHKKLPAAWEATVAAIHRRPFHPEAFLLLAEIALAAGDGDGARECARQAHDFAPGWNPARQFLKKSLKGNVKPAWLKLPGKNQNHLSVCLIVKNEEKFLDQCLKSIHGLAQQIVVVDTGSTDRTVEIARAHGAEIHSYTWDDDFAAARNAALEQATGDWVLILDADEELPVEQHPHLLADMAKAGMMAYRLPLVNLEHEAEGQNFVPRLFRNAPGVFYSGCIHEQVFPSLVPLGKSWGLALHFGTAQLLHHGYTKQMVQDRDKIRRNLGLLTRAVGEQPANANLMMNLGLELVRMNDLAGGVEKYRTAFKLMSAQKEDETAPELREVLLTQFTCQLYKIRAHGEVVQVLNSPLAKIGGLTASLHFALGLALFELKQFAAAAEQMRQCISLRRRPVFSPINTDILTSAPEHCLALSVAKTGDAAGAEKAFLAALAGTGRVADVKLDYAKFLAAQNRSIEAFHKLHELVAADSRNLAAWRTGGEIALGRPEFLEFAGNWTAEATRYVAEDFIVSRQRAETLLLGGDMKMAAELWERLWNSERQPVILAALILCETLAGQARHAPDRIVDEPATSRAFIKWYQKLIAMRAHRIVMQINDRLDEFSRTLPTAVGMLEKALAEPQRG